MDYMIDRKQLRIEMAACDFNKTKLAEKAGISRNTITSVLNGARPTTGAIEKIAMALNLPSEKIASIFFAQDLRNE
jgi:transcriptional regulator with XRE-family HTH domain